MFSAFLRAEQLGLVFWIASLVWLKRSNEPMVILFHCVALCLSFVAPSFAAAVEEVPASTFFGIWLLALVNGLLGVAWCCRVEPRVSFWPMLGITFAGVATSVALVVSQLTPVRLF